MTYSLPRKCLAEFIGTFALVFAGTSAIVVNALYAGVVTHVGVGLTFGLVIMAGIYSVGDVSGAHFNPAVSFGFWAARRFSGWHAAAYAAAQCGAAIAASFTVRLLFPEAETLGGTQPSGAVHQSFILEVLITCFLMYVILSVSTGAKEKGIMAGAAIGATVALAAIFGGPVSGASMNPARSIGPALVSAEIQNLWIYIAAPLLGAAIAVAACRGTRPDCGLDGAP